MWIRVMSLGMIWPAFVCASLLEDRADGWASQNGGTDGGRGGVIVEVTTLDALNAEVAKNDRRIVLLRGKVSGTLTVKGTSNKTIFGLPGSRLNGNVVISGSKNIILRNFTVQGNPCASYEECKAGADAVSITGASSNIWVDHCAIMDGQDGNLDINALSDFITVSYTKFSYTYAKEHAFSNLIGSADGLADHEGKLNTTYHHCWWADRINQRQPRTRYGKIHVVNNLYTSTTASYMVNAGYHASLLVESNVMNASGTPIAVDATTYGCTARNNIGSNASNSCSQYGSGFTPPYQLTIHPANQVEALLRAQAGATLPDPRAVIVSSSGSSSSAFSLSSSMRSSSSAALSSSAITSNQCGIVPCARMIQGEDFCEANGVSENKNSGYLGSGYVNADNAEGAAIGYVFHEREGVPRLLFIRYANGSASARRISVLLNGNVAIAEFSFPSTGSWTEWSTAEIPLDFPAGRDSLVLQSLSAEGPPNIDWIGWNDLGLSPAPCREQPTSGNLDHRKKSHSVISNRSKIFDLNGRKQQILKGR